VHAVKVTSHEDFLLLSKQYRRHDPCFSLQVKLLTTTFSNEHPGEGQETGIVVFGLNDVVCGLAYMVESSGVAVSARNGYSAEFIGSMVGQSFESLEIFSCSPDVINPFVRGYQLSTTPKFAIQLSVFPPSYVLSFSHLELSLQTEICRVAETMDAVRIESVDAQALLVADTSEEELTPLNNLGARQIGTLGFYVRE